MELLLERNVTAEGVCKDLEKTKHSILGIKNEMKKRS